MKTTELFAEQVLVGLLVTAIVGLVFWNPLMEFYQTHLNPQGVAAQIVAGGFLLGAAYLVGIVYDRIADTLLQDIEAHGRLQFALRSFKTEGEVVDKYKVPTADPFEDGKYRIVVLANSQATDHMEYLRSRIRLTRALATVVPGIMVSVLLAMDYGKASSWWTTVAASIPIVYGAILLLKVMERKKLFERPPKTYDLEGLRRYMDRACMLGENSSPPKHTLSLLFHDEVWIGLLLLVIAAFILIVSTRSYARFSILLVGLVLTIIVGWSWWRISLTFYSFLRDFQKHGARAGDV